MTTTLIFDTEQADRLQRLYTTPDVVARRRVARNALGLGPGERVLDVGCGPGFFAAEMGGDVGPSGRVAAVDTSPDVLGIAARTMREAAVPGDLHLADATSLPFEAGSFDAVVCVQVLEYVADPVLALSEMRRVVRRGGRVLVWDTDWRSLVWQAGDPVLMGRVLRAWEEHLVHPSLPRRLRGDLAEAGLTLTAALGHLTVNVVPGPSNYSEGVISLIEGFVPGRCGVSEQDVSRWRAGLDAAAADGTYHLASPQFCFLAERR